MITTFHRKMWQAKEEGYITQDEWKKLCNQPSRAFKYATANTLEGDYTNLSFKDALYTALLWGRTNEGTAYWTEVYFKLACHDV